MLEPITSPPSLLGASNERTARFLDYIARLRADHFDREDFAATVVRQISEVLRVARVGWWRVRYVPEAGLQLESGWWDGQSQTAATTPFLPKRAFPRYFGALAKALPIRAEDAIHDPRTSEFAEIYLAPNGIGAMLDAPVVRGGVVIGVLCMEHVGPARRWEDDEVQFANTLAGILAQRDAERETAATFGRLRDSERRFRELFDSSPDLLQSCQPDGRIAFVNSAWRRTLGYTDNEIEGLSLWDLIPPEQEEHCRKLLAAAFTGRTMLNVRLDLRAKDGRVVHLAGGLVPVLDGMRVAGCHAYLHEVGELVDEEKRRDAALASAVHELRTVELALDTLGDAIVVADETGEVLTMNARARRLFSTSTEAIRGRPFWVLGDADSYARLVAAARAAAESGAETHLSGCTGLRSDQSTFPMGLSVRVGACEGRRVVLVAIRPE